MSFVAGVIRDITFITLKDNSADDKLMKCCCFLFFYPENKVWHFMLIPIFFSRNQGLAFHANCLLA